MKTSRLELAHYIAIETQKAKPSKNFSDKLAAYLLAEHRSGELERIMQDVDVIRFEQGYVEAIIQSVRPLTSDVRKMITQLLKKRYPKAKNIALVERLDPALIGGVTIQLPDERIDLSVVGRIRAFRRSVAQRVNR